MLTAGKAAGRTRCEAGPRGRALALLMGLLLAAAGVPTSAQEADDPQSAASVDRGRRLVQRGCVGCHAVGPARASINRAAPPLVTMPSRHTPGSLQQAIATSPRHDSMSMPSVVLTRDEAADVIAYLKAFATATPRERRRLDVTPCIATAC